MNAEYKTNAVFYALLAGLVLSDIIPTPADAVYFSYQRKIKVQLAKGEIDSKEYWIRETAAYYLLNPLWWLIVIAIVVSLHTDFNARLKLLIGIAGSGAVVYVIYRNISQDETQAAIQAADKGN